MKEVYPWGILVPKNCRYLLLGTFPGNFSDPAYDFFFMSKRNQFWSILEEVYKLNLKDKKSKIKLLENLRMGMGDMIESCERAKGTNADNNLVNIKFNTREIKKVLAKHKIEKIYFSSRMAEGFFRKEFKIRKGNLGEIELITLPSSSPRYAAMRWEEKVKIYKKMLPEI